MSLMKPGQCVDDSFHRHAKLYNWGRCSVCLVLQLTIKDGELDAGIVNKQIKFDIARKIQLLYLGDTLRIARSAQAADTEAQAQTWLGSLGSCWHSVLVIICLSFCILSACLPPVAVLQTPVG